MMKIQYFGIAFIVLVCLTANILGIKEIWSIPSEEHSEILPCYDAFHNRIIGETCIESYAGVSSLQKTLFSILLIVITFEIMILGIQSLIDWELRHQ